MAESFALRHRASGDVPLLQLLQVRPVQAHGHGACAPGRVPAALRRRHPGGSARARTAVDRLHRILAGHVRQAIGQRRGYRRRGCAGSAPHRRARARDPVRGILRARAKPAKKSRGATPLATSGATLVLPEEVVDGEGRGDLGEGGGHRLLAGDARGHAVGRELLTASPRKRGSEVEPGVGLEESLTSVRPMAVPASVDQCAEKFGRSTPTAIEENSAQV